MEFKKNRNKYIVRIDKGEEIVSTLKKFCKDNDIKLGIIHGLGATNKAEIGLFKTKTKEYKSTILEGDHEIAPLYGNISVINGEPYLHIHATLGNEKHEAFSGHLSSAVVSATFEVFIVDLDGNVSRKFSKEIGLNLYSFE